MLPADIYRPGSYPPGPNWPRFGDPFLNKAFAGLSAEAQANLREKHEKMRQFHKDRLEKQGLSNVSMDPPPPWDPWAGPGGPPPPGGGWRPPSRDSSIFREPVEFNEEPDDAIVPVARPAFLPPPLADDPPAQPGIMDRFGELADQAAGVVGSNLSALAIEKGAELALAAGAAPGVVAAGAVAAGSALAPVAKEIVKGAGRLAYNVADFAVGEPVRFWMDEGRHALNQARQRFGERAPLETLISIPVLTAQDVIQHFLNQHSDLLAARSNDLLTAGDTDLLPVGRNVRMPPAWLPGAPQFRPTNYQPSSSNSSAQMALPAGTPETYGPENPYNQSSSSSSSAHQEASSSSSRPRHDATFLVYRDVDEWLANVPNRGGLVEQIWRRPGWMRVMGVEDLRRGSQRQGDFKEQIRRMSRRELARLLVYLDEQAGFRRTDTPT